jgi:DNA-binding MarR family transcriptional regulator
MRRQQQSSAPIAVAPMKRVPGLRYGALDDFLGYALRRAQNALYLDFARATAAFDITPARFAALTLIGENPGLAQNILAQAMGIDRSGALRLADWFGARGLAERRLVESDARLWGLHLTDDGRRTLAAMTTAVRAHDPAWAARVGADAPLLRDLLEKLAAPPVGAKKAKARGGPNAYSTPSVS